MPGVDGRPRVDGRVTIEASVVLLLAVNGRLGHLRRRYKLSFLYSSFPFCKSLVDTRLVLTARG